MRICRFSAGEEPMYGVLGGELDEYGQPGEDAAIVPLAGDPLYSGVKLLEQTEYAPPDVKLLAPVLPRSKVVGIGRNYASHAAEMGADPPSEPLMFLKPNTSVIGPGDTVVCPTQSEDVQYEGELAVVIGRICRDVPATNEDADSVIWGYTIGNDVTARDLQARDGQFTRAKGFDSFCPLGPWVETERDPQAFADGVRLRTYLNGDVVQDDTTASQVFGVPALVAYVSSVMTLLPGDVILTGTPAGVGRMEPGDEVEVSIDGLGNLTNPVTTR